MYCRVCDPYLHDFRKSPRGILVSLYFCCFLQSLIWAYRTNDHTALLYPRPVCIVCSALHTYIHPKAYQPTSNTLEPHSRLRVFARASTVSQHPSRLAFSLDTWNLLRLAADEVLGDVVCKAGQASPDLPRTRTEKAGPPYVHSRTRKLNISRLLSHAAIDLRPTSRSGVRRTITVGWRASATWQFFPNRLMVPRHFVRASRASAVASTA